MMDSLSLENSVKLLTFSLIIIFKLRNQRITSRKMHVFFTACHFLRTIRRFVVKLTADFQNVPVELIEDILNKHNVCSNDLYNTLLCGPELLSTNQTSSWMLVRTPDKQTSRWVFLVVLPIKKMGRNVLGNQTLQFNLFREEGAKTLNIFPETACPFEIPYATSVTIALTASSDLKQDANEKLKKFFEVPKYVQEDDYVNLCDSSAFIVKSIKTSGKAKKNAGYFIQIEKSSLFQVESEPALKPPVICKLRKNQHRHILDSYDDIMGSTIQMEPYGLADYCENVRRIIKPFLVVKKSHPVQKPTFLLSGPSGSGKRIIVKSVAASLGLHFMETHCLSLLGESTKASELRIRNVIQNALQMSPAILYLTDIEVTTISFLILELE